MKIVELIDNSEEPVYDLDAYLSNIKNERQKNQEWEIVKEFALKGTKQQKFVALTVISVNNPIFKEELSDILIETKNIEKIDYLLVPIVNICASFDKEKSINFLLAVLKYAKRKNKDYLYEITLRNIISTSSWNKVINYIEDTIRESNVLSITDLLAFIKYKQGNTGYSFLLNNLDESNVNKVRLLNNKILARYKSYKN